MQIATMGCCLWISIVSDREKKKNQKEEKALMNNIGLYGSGVSILHTHLKI